MNKILVFCFLFFIPLFLHAQEVDEFNNEFGINLTYNSPDGIGMSFRYRKDFRNAGILKLEANTDFYNTFIGRIGYEFLQLRMGKLELGTGFDLKYKNKDLIDAVSDNYQELSLELPLELRFQVSDKVILHAGGSFGQRLTSKNDYGGAFDSRSELRFGVGYRF